ncbi:SLC4A10, partial [Symbiodinium pilosum]
VQATEQASETASETAAETASETTAGKASETAEESEEKPGSKAKAMKKAPAMAAKAPARAAVGGKKSPAGKEDYVAAMVQSFLEKPLPKKNDAVSETRPLVFMHQHRAGGTTLRKLLYNETMNLKMKPHIQCSGGVDCRAFKNNVKDAAVYGGQFCWREMMTSLSGKQ